MRFLSFLLYVISFGQIRFFKSKYTYSWVSSSITGTLHLKNGIPCEDSSGGYVDQDLCIFYVVDGAGGMKNHEIVTSKVTDAISSCIDEFLAHSKSGNADQLQRLLFDILSAANNAAILCSGMASMSVYIASEKFGWGLLTVGDTVLIARHKGKDWEMPIAPTKLGNKRNITELIGNENLEHTFRFGDKPFDELFLLTDWWIGCHENALVLDLAPHAFVGQYCVNSDTVTVLQEKMYSGDGSLLSDIALYELLKSYRDHEAFGKPHDDLTVLYAKK